MLLETLQIVAEPAREESLALLALELAIAIVVVACLHKLIFRHFEPLEAGRLYVKFLRPDEVRSRVSQGT